MTCVLCIDTKTVARVRGNTVVDKITCPLCVRGVHVLGTHESLRPAGWDINLPTGTVIDGLLSLDEIRRMEGFQ